MAINYKRVDNTNENNRIEGYLAGAGRPNFIQEEQEK